MKFYKRLPHAPIFFFEYVLFAEKVGCGISDSGECSPRKVREGSKIDLNNFQEIPPCRELISIAKLYGVYENV